ncbi:MAG TPA: hypothetical protein VD902_21765 [Symbiobacteriaceae bacterium]|nr:hypothetical protein [Symbiobacteriaceae bacterium]
MTEQKAGAVLQVTPENRARLNTTVNAVIDAGPRTARRVIGGLVGAMLGMLAVAGTPQDEALKLILDDMNEALQKPEAPTRH